MKQRQRGQALIEMALIMPILILILMGILDFGLIFLQYQQLGQSAWVGGRYASLHSSDASGIETAVREATSGLLNQDHLTVTIDGLGGVPGQKISVIATYHYQFLTPVIERFASPLILRCKTMMMIEGAGV